MISLLVLHKIKKGWEITFCKPEDGNNDVVCQ